MERLDVPVQLQSAIAACEWGLISVDISRIHSVVARYQDFLEMAEGSEARSLAAAVEGCYGKINAPGVEALALSRILGLKPQDSCEVFRSLLDTTHPLRQAVIEYVNGRS